MEALAGSSLTLFAKAYKPLSPSKSLRGRFNICILGSRNSNIRVHHTSRLRQKALQLVVFTTSETAGIGVQPTEQSETVRVQFNLHGGESFLLVGSEPLMGQWNPSNATPMNWSDGNTWSIELNVPTGIAIQYKFILKKDTGDVLWQPGPDRILHTWRTKNTISIDEDWKDCELQKISEVQITNENEALLVDINVGPIIPRNVTHPEDQELVLNFTDKTASADVNPPFSSNIEVIIEEKAIKSADGTLLGIKKEVRVADNGNSAVKEESIKKTIPTTLTGTISESTKDEDDKALPTYEGVPSLTATQAVSSEEAILPKGIGTPIPSIESPPINSTTQRSMSSEELPKELGNLMSSEEALPKELGKSMSSRAALPTEEALPNELRKPLSSEEEFSRELGTSKSSGEAPPKELGTPMTTHGSIGTDPTERQNS
ncbi:unnamed protein product [Malus baccata var. baccata]